MQRNWQFIYDVLKVLINEGFVKLESFSSTAQYQLHLLHEINAVKPKNDYYTFTTLGVEIFDVLQRMKEERIDLNSIDNQHPKIVGKIDLLIEKNRQKRLAKEQVKDLPSFINCRVRRLFNYFNSS